MISAQTRSALSRGKTASHFFQIVLYPHDPTMGAGVTSRFNLDRLATSFLFQLKSGRTSAPRLPLAEQMNPRLEIRQPHVVWPAGQRIRAATSLQICRAHFVLNILIGLKRTLRHQNNLAKSDVVTELQNESIGVTNAQIGIDAGKNVENVVNWAAAGGNYTLHKVGNAPLIYSESGIYRLTLVDNRAQRNGRCPLLQ